MCAARLPVRCDCCDLSSLKGRGRVKAGFRGFAWWLGVRDWRLLFPGSCHSWPGGRVKDRAEPGRRGGAGGVLDAAGREPDNRAAGNGSRGGAGYRLSAVPCPGLPVRAVPLAAVIPSRDPRPGPGGMGRVRVRGGQAGSIRSAPAPPGRRGRQIAASRLPRPGKLFMPAALRGRGGGPPGSGRARRAGRRTPG